jgi:hypothetical protein
VANNRLFLKNPKTGERVLLAKYYPSTGWYTVIHNTTAQKQMDQFLCPSDREQTDDHDLFGGQPFVLEYEA